MKIIDHVAASQNGTYWIGVKLEAGRLFVYLPGHFDPMIFGPEEEIKIGLDSPESHNVPLHIQMWRVEP